MLKAVVFTKIDTDSLFRVLAHVSAHPYRDYPEFRRQIGSIVRDREGPTRFYEACEAVCIDRKQGRVAHMLRELPIDKELPLFRSRRSPRGQTSPEDDVRWRMSARNVRPTHSLATVSLRDSKRRRLLPRRLPTEEVRSNADAEDRWRTLLSQRPDGSRCPSRLSESARDENLARQRGVHSLHRRTGLASTS